MKEVVVVVMRILRRFWKLAGLLLSILMVSAWSAPAQTPVNSPEGGRIMYGVVGGATSQAGGMASILRAVHANCGERPQIGRVFKFGGTDTVGVFFTVVNHPAGNVKVAGLVMAARNPSQQVEAALLSDEASRFGKTVNPMLKELLSEWHPGGAMSTASASKGSGSGSTAGGHPSPPGELHTVAASDNSVSIGVPDGWTLDPASGRGAIIVKGPHGEVFAFNMMRNAVDPSSQWQRNFSRQGGRPLPGSIIYPYHGNLARVFPDLFQAWRRSLGQGPAKLQIDKIDQTPPPQGAPQGEECVIVKGHVDPDGNGMQTMSDMMCATLPVSWGGYMVILHHSLFPNSLAEQQESTIGAMMASWKRNAQVLNQQLAEDMRQKQASDQATLAWGRQAVAHINAIGANATARNNAAQEMHDMQNRSFEYHEDSISRNGQGFSNYLLDQTVVQDNNMYNNGTIGHGTVWNSAADALVKANPNRFQIVDTPNYWQGIDY
jgi:hypothetical protein